MISRLCFPPKLVSVLCVVQVTIIVLGVLITGIFLKAESVIFSSSFVPAAVRFVRFHGIWFLLLPLAWSGWAILRSRRESRVVELDGKEVWFGFALTTVIALFFAWTSLRALSAVFDWRGPMTIIEKGS